MSIEVSWDQSAEEIIWI